MNFYNPYYMLTPYSVARPSLFGALTRGIRGLSLGSIVSGTQRTLGIVNQAIPIIKQMSPVVKNAKTMFRVMNEFKKTDVPATSNKKINNQRKNNVQTEVKTDDANITSNNNGPTFFA